MVCASARLCPAPYPQAGCLLCGYRAETKQEQKLQNVKQVPDGRAAEANMQEKPAKRARFEEQNVGPDEAGGAHLFML